MTEDRQPWSTTSFARNGRNTSWPVAALAVSIEGEAAMGVEPALYNGRAENDCDDACANTYQYAPECEELPRMFDCDGGECAEADEDGRGSHYAPGAVAVDESCGKWR